MARKSKKQPDIYLLRVTMPAMKDIKGNIVVPEKTGKWHIIRTFLDRWYVCMCGVTMPTRNADGVIYALSKFDNEDKAEICEFCLERKDGK